MAARPLSLRSMPMRGTMNPNEFEDRYRALEALTVQLIRHMMLRDVFSREDVEGLMDSLETVSEGDAGSAFSAERLKRMVEGSGGFQSMQDMAAETRHLAAERARIYGCANVPADL